MAALQKWAIFWAVRLMWFPPPFATLFQEIGVVSGTVKTLKIEHTGK
jgi:hypothetical protein